MIKRLLLVTILSFTGFIHAYSQISTWIESGRKGESEYFKHFDVGINAGTTGIGFELGSQINDFVNLRTGFDFVPHFTYDMEFTIQVGDSLESKYDKDGKRVKTKFDRMADYLEQITGLEVEQVFKLIEIPPQSDMGDYAFPCFVLAKAFESVFI